MYTPVAVLLLVVFIHSGECGLWLEDQRLTGWKGETYFPEEVAQKDARIQTLSHKPRAFFYHNMLSERETSHLISLAAPYMKRSMVYGGGNGGVYSERSSLGTFLWRMQDPVIAGIQNKVAQWTGIPSSHQEMIQVLRYEGPGQQYAEHSDYIRGPDQEDNPRLASVIIYLTDFEGGETFFKEGSKSIKPVEPSIANSSPACTRDRLSVQPEKGGALLFFLFTPNGALDTMAFHGGCPVTRGVKWVAVIWSHANPYQPGDNYWTGKDKPGNPGDCYDERPLHCRVWAKIGYCKSKEFMTRLKPAAYGYIGDCRKTCGICEQCAAGDRVCQKKNWEKSGFEPIKEAEWARV